MHKRRVNRSTFVRSFTSFTLHSLILSIFHLSYLKIWLTIFLAAAAASLHSITFIRIIYHLFTSIPLFFATMSTYVHIDDIFYSQIVVNIDRLVCLWFSIFFLSLASFFSFSQTTDFFVHYYCCDGIYCCYMKFSEWKCVHWNTMNTHFESNVLQCTKNGKQSEICL